MSITLQEIRTKYPQYNDLPDDVLADKLYNKNYSDMPRDQFNQKIGYTPPNAMVNAINKYAIDPVNALGAGMARTIAGTAGLPGTAYDYVRGKFDPKYDASQNPYNVQNVTKAAGAAMDVGNTFLGAKGAPSIDYTGEPGSLAEVAGRLGEFAVPLPGSGKTKILTDVVAPALGSLAVEKVANNYAPDWVKPYAPIAGALLGHGIGSKAESIIKPLANPQMVNPALATREAALNQIESAGINTTPGSYAHNQNKFANEMKVPATKSILESQPGQYTNFTLRESGLPELKVGESLPAHVEAGRESIGSDIGAITDNLAIDPMAMKKSANTPFKVIKLNDQIKFFSDNGMPVDGKTFANWRSDVSRDTRSIDPAAREEAKKTLEMIDDVLEHSLDAAGRPEDFAQMQYLRGKYRNILALEDAVEKSRANGFENVVLPTHMYAALKQQGGKSLIRGGRDTLGEVTKNASVYLPKDLSRIGEPNKSWFSHALRIGTDAALGAAGYMLGSASASTHPWLTPALTGAGAVIGEGVREGYNRLHGVLAGSKPVQYAQKRIALNPSNATWLPKISEIPRYTLPVAYSAIGRKSGGRVSTHDMEADQLVRAAERAKKGWNAETEPLLNQSDDAVAHALEVANRSI